jgi:hypothetical protein
MEPRQHPRVSQVLILTSQTPSLNGRAARVDRLVPDYLTHNAKHAIDFLRRVHGQFVADQDVVQVTLHPGPNDDEIPTHKDHGNFNAIWVLEDEISIVPYNYGRSAFITDEDKETYLVDPTTCIYANCRDQNLKILGVGLRDAIKVKIECQHCMGQWAEVHKIEGVEFPNG